ncbi:MAG: hypothetical protein IJR40_07705 [Treponema sp.]|nr:hypothetical protein [Treponema sp.]MBQ9627044.1 hypothetical protein [Treponema sp.]
MKEKKDKKEKKLKRVEIILSAAVDEDFMDGFKKKGIGAHFTKISGVTGAGFSNPKLGDSVWPQLNEMLLVYCDKEEAEKIVDLVEKVRDKYPMEGIACFVSKAKAR